MVDGKPRGKRRDWKGLTLNDSPVPKVSTTPFKSSIRAIGNVTDPTITEKYAKSFRQ